MRKLIFNLLVCAVLMIDVANCDIIGDNVSFCFFFFFVETNPTRNINSQFVIIWIINR